MVQTSWLGVLAGFVARIRRGIGRHRLLCECLSGRGPTFPLGERHDVRRVFLLRLHLPAGQLDCGQYQSERKTVMENRLKS